MSTRYLIAAAFLFGSACGAQADVLPASSSAQSGFLSSWTTGGTDVASTGVLGSGTTLVGGGSTSVAQALYQKASANASATDGKINLSMAEGLSGTYVLKTSNKALAATYGDGAQVMTTADGIVISDGKLSDNLSSGGSSSSGSSGSQGSNSTPTSSAPVNSKPVASKPADSTQTGSKPVASETGSGNNSSPAVNNGGTDVAVGGAIPQLPSEINAGTDIGAGLPTVGPAASGEVPEPSSIALLMAGMMGALALTRRRAR